MILPLNSSLPGRPAERRNEILDFVHGLILSGKLKPGDRLPIRRKLQVKFNSSMATVQQAMDHLVAEGFVESRGVGGTFVAANPPHLSQYAVIIPAKSAGSPMPLFWKTLKDSFDEHSSRSDVSIKYCYWPTEQASTHETRSLARTVSRRSIAGLVFITPPLEYEKEKIDLLNSGSIPCVVTLQSDSIGKFKAATVNLDDLAFIRKAMEHFAAGGCKRVAVISNMRKDYWWDGFSGTAKGMGLETRAYWNISVSDTARGYVRNMANLLMQLPKAKAPDALLITDDNLAKFALDGLQDSGSAAVWKLRIVSHSNFPFRTHTQMPVKFLGFDSSQVVRAFMSALERQRRGEEPLRIVEKVSPVFDDERGGQNV